MQENFLLVGWVFGVLISELECKQALCLLLSSTINILHYHDLQVEYTMQLQVDGKTYLAASNTKKAAKQACASEAWNAIWATLL